MTKFTTRLALEPTTLAWIRTTLTMASFEFGAVAFFRTVSEKAQTPEAIEMHTRVQQFGLTLIALGIFATVLAGISYWYTLRRLRRNEAVALTNGR